MSAPKFRQTTQRLKRTRNRIAHRVQSALGVLPIRARLSRLETQLEAQAIVLGRLATWQCAGQPATRLSDWEFKIFSQWGEDGIIQAIIHRVEITRPIFVEFGVDSYEEANTRFLLMNDNWSGLVMDSSEDNIARIRKSEVYWRYNLKAEQALITCENINALFKRAGISGEIGLLSIDIDGNDYWVWKALDVVHPDIAIVEYNHRFGPTASVTVPYKPDFDRGKEHFSMIYYGASLSALCKLGEAKGYAFVGCNSAGNNAFFIRRDKIPSDLRVVSAEQGYVAGKFREARDEDGELAFWQPEQEARILSKLPITKV